MSFHKTISRLASTTACTLLLACAPCFGQGTVNPKTLLVPLPNELSSSSGHFTLNNGTKIFIEQALNDSCKQTIESWIKELRTVTGYKNLAAKTFKAKTSSKYSGVSAKIVSAAAKGIHFVSVKNLPAEGYELTVTPDNITVKASSHRGIFYAIQTMKQLFPTAVYGKSMAANTVWAMPCVNIKDEPRFGYRGVMIDVSRHFFSADEMKRIIDVMAVHKLNTLHWHLTDDQGWRIEIKRYPLLTEYGSIRKKTMIRKEWDNYDNTPYGGFYTQEQIKDIVKYAAKRCITIIPEIDLPGHMMAALACYPNLGCTGGPYEVSSQWGVRDDVLCPGKEETFKFIEGVLTEVMQLFPSKLIHIGGDECPKVRWEKCPLCQARIKAEGIKGNEKHSAEFFLQSYVTERVEKFINAHGRQIIGWDEILEGKLAPKATVMSWRGMDGGLEAAQMHHPVIMSPNTYVYLDYYQSLNTADEPLAIGGYLPVERVYSLEPVPAQLNENEAKYIIGAQGNLWTEYIASDKHLEYMLLPRLAALSEVQWTKPALKDYKRFLDGMNHITKIYDTLGMNYATHIFDVSPSYSLSKEKPSTVTVTLTTQGDAPIYYKMTGDEYAGKQMRYTQPIDIKSDCQLTAYAERAGRTPKQFRHEFQFNKATGCLATLNTKPSDKYKYAGASILTDGLRGDFNYGTGYWIGFLNEPLDATIDFGKEINISSVAISCLQQLGEWIFPPTKISVWTSYNGSDFTLQGENNIPIATPQTKDGLEVYNCNFKETKASSIRIKVETTSVIPEWHGAKGEKGYLFADEIIVK